METSEVGLGFKPKIDSATPKCQRVQRKFDAEIESKTKKT